MITGYIYSYMNNITKQYYVGQTLRSIEERAKENGKGYLNQPKFGAAIKEYGWENFTLTILETISSNDLNELISKLNELEKYYIQKFDSYNTGYNCTKGGKNCLRPSTFKVLNFELQGDDNIEKCEVKVNTELKIEENYNKNSNKKIIGVCVPFDIYQKIKEEADDNFISVSDVVRKIIYLYIKNKNC